MTILGIDTSNQGMALALGEEAQVLATYMTANQKNHSTTLMPAIDFLLTSNGKKPKDLTKIIIAEGPGSYTGLRIGVTTAKTLAWTLGIDLYAVSSLAVIAAGATDFNGLIVPLINARRENVYTAAFKWEDNKLRTQVEDHHTSLALWLSKLKELKQPVLFIGTDVSIFEELIDEADEGLFSYKKANEDNVLQGTAFFKLVGQLKEVADIEGFIPKYLKKVEAEEKWLETNQGEEESSYVERV